MIKIIVLRTRAQFLALACDVTSTPHPAAGETLDHWCWGADDSGDLRKLSNMQVVPWV